MIPPISLPPSRLLASVLVLFLLNCAGCEFAAVQVLKTVTPGRSGSLLVSAADQGDLEFVKELIVTGRNAIEERACRVCFTALIAASSKGHLPVVQYLLGAGADPNSEASDNGKIETSLTLAASRCHAEVVTALATSGAQPRFIDGTGRYVLAEVIAAWNTPCSWDANAQLKTARALLQFGADPNMSNGTRERPLVIAAGMGNLAMAKLLLDFGADVHGQSKPGGITPMRAARSVEKLSREYPRAQEIESLLIARGAQY
jgi:ankyrin repeat protein